MRDDERVMLSPRRQSGFNKALSQSQSSLESFPEMDVRPCPVELTQTCCIAPTTEPSGLAFPPTFPPAFPRVLSADWRLAGHELRLLAEMATPRNVTKSHSGRAPRIIGERKSDSQTPLGSPPHFNRFSSILY